MPILSIIIPCYNVARFLPQTLRSLRQLKDADDVEFIFINDGSTDDTLALLQTFAADDRRAIVMDQPNLGVAVARNNGMQRMTGEYMLLLDGDDWLDDNAVICILEHLRGADALLPNIRFITDPGTPTPKIILPEGVYTPDELFRMFAVFPVAPQLIYKTSVIREHQLQFNPLMQAGEVFDFTMQHLAHCSSVATTNQAFYNYFFHPASATHLPNPEADRTVLRLLDRQQALQTPWKNSYCLQATLFKLITSFTYNKYLRSGLLDEPFVAVVEAIDADPRFRKIVRYLSRHSLRQPKILLLAAYLRLMPIRWGYRCAAKVYGTRRR